MLTFGSLFAGIGGFDLGLERAGLKSIWQCEIDKDCQKVLKRHWLDTRLYNDVKEINRSNAASPDVLVGGFPCQDLSVAGKRTGLAGERSGLWFEFHRVIAELKPRWVVIENVPGLLSSNEGRDFAIILRGLAECGYYAAWRVLDAQYFGVAQRRRRVFIVASLGNGSCAQVLFESEGGTWDSPPGREKRPELARDIAASLKGSSGEKGFPIEWEAGLVAFGGNNTKSEIAVSTAISAGHGSRRYDFESETFICNAFNGYTGGADDNDAQGWHIVPALSETLNSGGNDGGFRTEPGAHVIAFTERTRAEGRTFEAQENIAYALTNPGSGGRTHSRQIAGSFGVRRLTPVECERLQGFPDGWTEGQSDSVRYRQLGNAVARPCGEWIGRRIAAVESIAI